MKSDALQLFVRGFGTQEKGDKIVRVLQDIGFEIKEKFDGSQDSIGGLIETHIVPLDHLTADNLDDIGQAIRRVAGEQAITQYDFWDRVSDAQLSQEFLMRALRREPSHRVADDREGDQQICECGQRMLVDTQGDIYCPKCDE